MNPAANATLVNKRWLDMGEPGRQGNAG